MSKGGGVIKGRVIVAMSGGVDSSLAAALLKQEQYEVIGLTLQLVEGTTEFPPGEDPVELAKQAAGSLNIPHHTLDLREDFQHRIIDYFIAEYRRGRTPNPCVICNRHIKFAALYRQAEELGADYLATGHYARVEYSSPENRYLLRKGLDALKEQSYMLYNLSQQQLSKSLFPLGHLTKVQVRNLARELGLNSVDRAESQEICFIPGNDYRKYLRRRGLSCPPGPIVDRSGRWMGTHQGIAGYTVGQRRGLGLTSPVPLYVLEIRTPDNTLVVGEKEGLYQPAVTVESFNYVSTDSLLPGQEVEIKIRYRSPGVLARLEQVGPPPGLVRAVFEKPQPAVTPGQAAVFYRGDLLLGGGIICGTD